MPTEDEQWVSHLLHTLTPEPPSEYSAARTARAVAVLDRPPVDATVIPLAQARPPRRRRRAVVAALAAAAAVAAMAVGVATGGSDDTGNQAASGGGITPRTLTFGLRPGSGVEVAGAVSTGTLQGLQLLGHRGERLELTAFARGVPLEQTLTRIADGEHLPGLRPIDVNGHRGQVGTVDNMTLIAWPYATDSWAMVRGTAGKPTRTLLARVARAVDLDATTKIRTPVRLDRAPAGMQLAAVTANYRIVGRGADGFNAEADYLPNNRGGGVEIVTSSGHDTRPTDAPRFTVGGRSAYWNAELHRVCLDVTTRVQTCVGQSGDARQQGRSGVSRAELTRIAGRLTFPADPSRPSTWFEAETALP